MKGRMGARRASRHLVYHELREALEQGALCALCALETKALERYFSSVFHESVNDPSLREELRRSRGFCPRHSRVMLRSADALGMAILCEDQVRLALADLSGRGGPGASVPCPACRLQDDARSRYSSVLLQWLEEPGAGEVLERAGGLCLPHLKGLLQKAGGDARRRLEAAALESLETLAAQLREFQRKQDYRFRHEVFGPEADSWRRAVRLLTGEEDVF